MLACIQPYMNQFISNLVWSWTPQISSVSYQLWSWLFSRSQLYKNMRIFILTKVSFDLDKIWRAAAMCWCIEAHTLLILHDCYSQARTISRWFRNEYLLLVSEWSTWSLQTETSFNYFALLLRWQTYEIKRTRAVFFSPNFRLIQMRLGMLLKQFVCMCVVF